MSVELLVDARARLGECPLWCERTGSLYWTDIQAATLSRWRAADGRLSTWTLPERVGSFALCEETTTQLLLGLESGIALFDTEREALTPTIMVEPEHPSTRINDGRCDAQGRFVFGMFNEEPHPIGHFYRVGADLAIERLSLPRAAVANSIAFSPDGARIFFTDSPTGRIECADYHADGRIGTPRPFVQIPPHQGDPDGSTVDADGGLWNARWDGGCVVRYDADGVETARIGLPVSRPTCAAFGGPNFDQLFITTARAGLSSETLAREPAAGGIFRVEPVRRGCAEHRFRTPLRA